jgi:hypothetical protein
MTWRLFYQNQNSLVVHITYWHTFVKGNSTPIHPENWLNCYCFSVLISKLIQLIQRRNMVYKKLEKELKESRICRFSVDLLYFKIKNQNKMKIQSKEVT